MRHRLLTCAAAALAGAAAAEVTVRETGGCVRVEAGGALFAAYRYQDVARPFLYPVLGPGGLPMTRGWPMDPATNEPTDHVHHKGLWLAHGDVNGIDFWSEQKAYGKTVHQRFLELKSGPDEGLIRSLNAWVSPSGTVVCTDERALRFRDSRDAREIDVEVTLIASHGAVVFGDTKEGSFAIRLPAWLRVAGGTNSTAHITSSAGLRDGAAWGREADWVDYAGASGGRAAGVAILSHPSNPRHPTRWHVRTYGLFAANPFGRRAFDKQAAGAGGLALAPGERATFRYRFVFYAGAPESARLAERFARFARE